MQHNFLYPYIREVKSFPELEEKVSIALHDVRVKTTNPMIGYVSGIISSEGENHISKNMTILAAYTTIVKHTWPFPIFSPTDVLPTEIFQRISAHTIPQNAWIAFWRRVLQYGVTDVFFTPRWRRSEGALDEYAMAKKLGLRMHIIHNRITHIVQ